MENPSPTWSCIRSRPNGVALWPMQGDHPPASECNPHNNHRCWYPPTISEQLLAAPLSKRTSSLTSTRKSYEFYSSKYLKTCARFKTVSQSLFLASHFCAIFLWLSFQS